MQLSKIALALAFYSGIAALPTKAKCAPVGNRDLQKRFTGNTQIAVNHGSKLQTRAEEKLHTCGKCKQFTTNSAAEYFSHYSQCNGKLTDPHI
ncbi:hypothetical protein PpBr36_01998 [Pyricularia pennisetigena]|uniref:hypothetical protein n=1 Tax=Pyricularia pennisetigena TaxID=1578925 RepID=UPI00114F20F8|nr:hypothetical protein PpBr36_01998 [Pyricularia pennisetigena]TLS28450.1 hypothetical protein PpBr36_01998 [Pyricularia pennisetigena]